jgi:hypothetical protein
MSGLVQGLVHRARMKEPSMAFKYVLVRLADEADDEGHDVYPAIATIAEDIGCSVATVKRALAWLRDGDWIRVDGSASGGRGRSTRYWINVPALLAVKRPARSRKAIPDAKTAPAKGCHSDTLSDGKRVSSESKRVSSEANTVSSGEPLPFTRSNTLSARDANGPLQASQRRDARWPASHGKGRSASGQAGAALDRSGNGSALGAAPRTKWENEDDLINALAVKVDPAAYDAWASLVVAVAARRQAQEARAWLSFRNVVSVNDGVIVVSNALTASKVNEIFGALLAEQGWRVAVSGAGG